MSVKELLDTPEKWTKNALAKDSKNRAVMHNDNRACKWCLLGAIYKSYRVKEWTIITTKVNQYLYEHFGYSGISVLRQDHHEYEDIKKLVDTLNI